MTSVFIQPMDFKTIYINYFLGNQALFPYLFIILFSFIAATLNISNTIFLILLGLGSLMFGAYMGQSLYVFTLFIIGFFVYKIFTRILQ